MAEYARSLFVGEKRLRILLIGTSTNPAAHTAGFNHGYKAGFEALGHQVDSISHREAGGFDGDGYDFFLLRDATISPKIVQHFKDKSRHFALFTHAEYAQAKHERSFIEAVKPEHIFLDQQEGDKGFEGLGTPCTFLGYGANPETRRAAVKDIDVLWVGHGYHERQARVEAQVYPLLDTEFNVKIHGRAQKDGALTIPKMYEVMSRARIVIHLCGLAAIRWGYGGRRIYDALSSGAFVVSDKFPHDEETFPYGTSFVPVEQVHDRVLWLLRNADEEDLEEMTEAGFEWVREGHMISHVAQEMLDIVGVEG